MDGQTPPARQRTLLPAPSRSRLDAEPVLPRRTESLAPRLRNASAACAACRRRKTKCDATRPACRYCISRSIPCHYDADEGETQGQALKRKFDELVTLDESSTCILTALRDRPEAEAGDILRNLREIKDVRTVARHIEHGDLLLQIALAPEANHRYEFPFRTAMPPHLLTPDNHYLQSLVYEWSPVRPGGAPTASSSTFIAPDPYLKPYHAAKLTIPYIESIQPSKWTAVTTDDVLMRALLSAYFLQESSWYTCVQPEYLLYDMANMSKDLCSPLLVNVLLALACHCYRGLADRCEHWNPSTLGYRFFVEAKRLWELEIGTNSLTNLQAALLLSLYYCSCGIDRFSWTYTLQATQMAYDMDLFRGCPKVSNKRLRDAAGFTAWALFSWQSLIAFHFFRAPLLEKPPSVPLPDPTRNPRWYGELVLQYPPGDTPVSAQFGPLFKAKSDFRIILNDLAQRLFGTMPKQEMLTIEEAVTFRKRFSQWEDSLPPALSSHRIVLPAQLLLHMHRHTVAASIFSPFHSPPLEMEMIGGGEALRETFIKAKISLETLLRLYYLRHGFEYQDTILMVLMLSCGLMAIEDLAVALANNPGEGATAENSHVDGLRSTIILMAKGLYDQGLSLFYAKAVLQVLSRKMRPEERAAVWQFAKIEDDFQLELAAQHILSDFPVDIVSVYDNPDAKRISTILRQYQLETTNPAASSS